MRKILMIMALVAGFVLPGFSQTTKNPRNEVRKELKSASKSVSKEMKSISGDTKADRREMRREMREFKIKFLAQEMDLKDTQKKQFSEVYGRMSEEKHKIFHETRQLERKLDSGKGATEEEYAEVSRAITEAKARDAAVEKKYDTEFAKFLSPKQIYQMKQAEEKFRRRMDEMRKEKKRHKK